MRNVFRRRLGAMAFLAVMAFLTALAVGAFLVGRLRANGMAWAGEFGSIAAFLLALVLAIVACMRFFFTRVLPPPISALSVGQAALANALGRQWAEEERWRRINDPNPMPVRWEVTPTAEEAMRGVHHGLAGEDADAPSRRSFAGEFGDVLSVFDRVPSRRLVILGSAGAGKSVLVTKLARDLLAAPQTAMLVPVIFSAATWDPDKGLSRWISDQLIGNYPGLDLRVKAATGKPTSLPDALADGGVLPIIDGLDELPQQLRSKAIAAINARGSDMPLVVTSRPEEYLGAVAANGRAISRAMVVEVLPLRVPQVETYLGEATAPVPAERWRTVFDRLDDPHGPLTTVLTTPLMLWLARTIYEPSNSHAPSELAAFGDQEAIEHHLLDAFVPAIYANGRWTPRQAQRWLAFLAAYLDDTRSPDLAWWRLNGAVRGWRPIGSAVRAALLFAVAWGLAVSVLRRHRANSLPVNLRELLLGGPLGRHILPAVNYYLSLFRRTPHHLRSELDDIISLPPWRSLPSLEIWITLIAVGLGVLLLALGYITPEPKAMKIRVIPVALSAFNAVFNSLFVACLGGLVLGAFLAPINPTPAEMMAFFHMGSATRLLLLLPILWGLTSVPGSFSAPLDVSRSIRSPAEVLGLDRQATLLAVTMKRASRTALIWLCCGTEIALAYGLYAVTCLLCKILLGGIFTASAIFADARIWLACRRRMPWRTMTFLIDAKKRGVLRQAGAVYQFRHISLQQRLSARHRRWSRRLVSAAARGIRRYEGPLPLSLRYWWLHSSAQWPELWALRFEEAARTKSWLGAPAGKVHREGPGCYQSFDGVGGDHAWVICALPGQPPMVVGKPVWEALRQAGIGAPGDALAAVGFPVAEYDYTGLGRVVPADATRIELGGGSWGPGLLVRDDGCDDWGWQSAKTRFFLTTRAGWQGTRFFLPRLAGSQLPQLRVRAEATIPWAISGLAITPQALQEMADTLAFSDLTRAVTELSARRGSVLPTASWQESVTGRSIDRRSLAYVVTAPDGRPVMTAEVIVSLPSSGHSDLVTIAELRVEDFEAWPDALNAAGGTLLDESQLRLSPDELLGFLAAAWHTVAEVLPALVVEHPGVEHPGAVPFASPPVSELLLAAEARHNQTVSRRDLRDLVDFSSLIIGDGRQLPMVSVQITGPLRLSREDRQMRTREVLTYMARGVGLNNPRGGWQLPGWTELSNIDLKEPRSDS